MPRGCGQRNSHPRDQRRLCRALRAQDAPAVGRSAGRDGAASARQKLAHSSESRAIRPRNDQPPGRARHVPPRPAKGLGGENSSRERKAEAYFSVDARRLKVKGLVYEPGGGLGREGGGGSQSVARQPPRPAPPAAPASPPPPRIPFFTRLPREKGDVSVQHWPICLGIQVTEVHTA